MLSLVKKHPFLHLFWLVAGFKILGHLLENNVMLYITTPLLALSLLLHYRTEKVQNTAFSFALILCFMGDTTLLVDHFNYFIAGLTAYWGASILFYISFLKCLDGGLIKQLKKKKALWPLGLYAVYLVGLMYSIHSFMEDLFYPTFLYAITLSLTCGISGLLWLEKRNTPAKNVFLGCFLLSTCATLIGLNKFVFTDNPYRFLEDLFYTPSLYFLYLGFKDPFFNENL